ncbi:MAG: L-threonylcarbamoyladenylate synthase [candidate division WOR-3 bacterium]
MRLVKIASTNLGWESELIAASEIIKKGGLVIFPTETVYGLGADALNPEAVALVYKIKSRPKDQPLSIAVAEANAIKRYVQKIPPIAFRLMEKFLPGPLTLILLKSKIIPDIVTGGIEKIGIRIPDHPVALSLLQAVARPLTATSANRTGKPGPQNVNDIGPDLKNDVDLILDAGPTKLGIESTIIDLTDKPTILRIGAISKAEIEAVIGTVWVK